MKTPVSAGAFFLFCARAFCSCLGLWTGQFLNLYPNLDPPLLEKRNDHIVQPVIWKGEIAEKLAGWVFQIQSVPAQPGRAEESSFLRSRSTGLCLQHG